MSILIKGMEMPVPGAYTCELGVLDNNTAVLTIYTPIDKPQRSYRLIPVPPHGQLIDADALCKILRSLAENEYTPEVFANWIENHIDAIIPAEEEKS